jgi:hypothetical protein
VWKGQFRQILVLKIPTLLLGKNYTLYLRMEIKRELEVYCFLLLSITATVTTTTIIAIAAAA